MHNNGEKDDRLLKYLTSDTKEHAPDGFTERVMTRITLERVTRATNYTPPFKLQSIILTGTLFLLLISILALLPGSDLPDNLFGTVSGFFSEFKPLLPDFKSLSPDGINIPAVLVWLSVSVFLLTLFDRALASFFRNNRKKNDESV